MADISLDEWIENPKKFIAPEKFLTLLEKDLLPVFNGKKKCPSTIELSELHKNTANKIRELGFLNTIYFKHHITPDQFMTADEFKALGDDADQSDFRKISMVHTSEDRTVSYPQATFVHKKYFESDHLSYHIECNQKRGREFVYGALNILLEKSKIKNELKQRSAEIDLFVACIVSGRESQNFSPEIFEKTLVSSKFNRKPLAKLSLFLNFVDRMKVWHVFHSGSQASATFNKMFADHVVDQHGLFIHMKNERFGDHHYGENREIGLLFNSNKIQDLPQITFFSDHGCDIYSSQSLVSRLPTIEENMCVPLPEGNSQYVSPVDCLLHDVLRSETTPQNIKAIADRTLKTIDRKVKGLHRSPS